MFKLCSCIFLIAYLLVSKNYAANTEVTVVDDKPSSHLIPYATNILQLFSTNRAFDAFIETQTKEVFYLPRSDEALQNLLEDINRACSIYTEARTSKKQENSDYGFPYNPEPYQKSFTGALTEISRTKRISDTNIRDIFCYLASLQEVKKIADVWDSIRNSLGLIYNLDFVDGLVFLNFSFTKETSKDWKEDAIADIEDAYKAAIFLGFKIGIRHC